MTDQLISVIVPFYNNADLLGDCLASIAAQTHVDLQVVMVDDGSTDGSAKVARAQAAADPRFTLLSVPNGGPGAARNHGVAAATGKYLAFVDADDLLPPDAYATLLAVLDRSGSDFVSGAVRRLTAAGLSESGLHDRAVKTTRLATHISATPELFYDISVWNKLFLRSFWEENGLRLPEGMLWEDLVAMTKAHVLARSVDVLAEPIYYWRDRDKGAPSITQSRTDIANFRDRITALGMIDDFLRSRASAAMLRRHQHKALVNDLWLYVRDLSRTSQEYQHEFVELASRYLRQVDQRVVDDLPSAHKLAYYLIGQGRQAELAEFASWLAEHPGRTPPMVRKFGRLRADLPIRRAGDRAVPARVFRPHWRELDPAVQVDKLSWHRKSIVIEGSAYVPSVDIARRRNTTKLVLLVPHSRRRPPVLLRARSVRRPDVTVASGQDRYSYEWSGFRCAVSPRWFGAGRRWLTGQWDCFVLVRGRLVWRPARLHTPGPDAEHPEQVRIAPGLSFGPRWAGRRLQVTLSRSSPVVPQASPVVPQASPAKHPGPQQVIRQTWSPDGQLLLRGGTWQDVACQVVLRHLDGWEQYVFPVTRAGDIVSAALPVGAVAGFAGRLPLRDGRWEVRMCPAEAGAAGVPPGYELVVTDGRPTTVGRKVYRCAAAPAAAEIESAADSARMLLLVGPALRMPERGRVRRKLLRAVYYPLQRLRPVRDDVLFVSFSGKSCADNPRAIADELHRRGDARAHVWAVSDWSTAIPPGGRAVLIGTAAYFDALARSRYLVANDHMPLPFRKRAGQRYVQTWHGTPLKRIGYDIGTPRSASGARYFDFMAADVAQWDLLISPNPFSTPIMRAAFGFPGEIAETGYPRNDALVVSARAAGTEPVQAEDVRKLLGLPAGKRLALYVPTWRDNKHDAAGRYSLDFQLDLDAARSELEADFTLLIRGHHLMAGGIPGAAKPGFVVDVTGYPDINHLLLVADVLITDYSSVMFDFAPTGRPMLFFTYDLAQYRDHLRGFYFDFESDAPGPLLTTSEEVVRALAELESVAARYATARDTFAARFCPLDDGKASARACDRIFGG
ncbi:MAG TPA: bifunctional glycosyltransferase family 2 protein/CDP-glycerol:glycerophosphate glycerophosphotransferase [Streptosporangiaceae bacterium]|nr:bifunctional glycosyltransferase family 2 protein/CDP-glycerol:glycerophosphate glycerophosphotransferase [Streptosporangiaceae bacterium]